MNRKRAALWKWYNGMARSGSQWRADCVQAIPLLQGRHFQALLADKGYDTDALIAYVEGVGAKAIIPPKSNRIVQRDYDQHFYKERYKIECSNGNSSSITAASSLDSTKLPLDSSLSFTLTTGFPQVVEVMAVTQQSESKLLQIAAALESLSEHPIGNAIVQAAQAKHLEWSQAANVQAHTGQGIVGEVDRQKAIVEWHLVKRDHQPSSLLFKTLVLSRVRSNLIKRSPSVDVVHNEVAAWKDKL